MLNKMTLATAVLFLLFFSSVNAGVGVNAEILLELVTVSKNAAAQLKEQIKIVESMGASLKNDEKNLLMLDGPGFDSLRRNLSGQSGQIDELLNLLRKINYTTNNIDNQYRKLYPSDNAWASLSDTQYEGYYEKWSDQLHEASMDAMKSQSLINNIKNNNSQAMDILSQSKHSDGQIRQLQAINEMLSIVVGQLSDLTTTLVTSSRLSASEASSLQAKQDMQREAARKFFDDSFVYKNNGHRYGVGDF